MKTTIDKRTFWWMLLTVAVTMLPHLPYVQPWLGVCAVLVLIGQAWRIHQDRPAPGWLITTTLAIGAGIGVMVSYQTLLGKQAGIALLVILLNLKLLESRGPRDLRVCVLLAFFLQLGLFLDTESALVALVAVTGTWCATVTLIHLSGVPDPRHAMRVGGLLIAQSIPLMLLLFFLFPRIPGPLWGLPEDAFAGRTGLSDTMKPGSIAQLIESGAVAFRVKFDDQIPPRQQLYWRGPVLTRFDGRQWTGRDEPSAATPGYSVSGPRYAYTMTLEPHDKTWLLGLDYPGPGIREARYGRDFELLSPKRVQQRMRFDATAYPESVVGLRETEAVLDASRALPEGRNPRSIALARSIRREASSDEDVVTRALVWMRDAQLAYTLRPPLLGQHTSDEFLFDTRRGFCEHFANSFVILMRAAGIPARVVTGYQGGELNPYDGQMVIRQSDAHAWAEVWLDSSGWRRVDPTAEAHPARIDEGVASALGTRDALPLMIRPDLQWLRDLRHRWDFVNNAWNQWVLGYNQSRQRDLLSRLGIDPGDWVQIGGVLMTMLGAMLGGLLLWANRGVRERDPVARQWRRFEQKLQKAGIPRLPHEGPADYARRAGSTLVDQRDAIDAIAQRYSRMRYGRGVAQRADIRLLKSMIDRLTC